MKKALASITLICYLAVSTGMVVNFHYCMNRLASVHVFETKNNICGKCGMKMHKSHGCCRDEVKVFKIQDDQNKAQVVHQMQAPDAVVNIPSSFIITSFYNNNESSYQVDHSPPLVTGQDTYLQNCVFRI